MCGTRLLRILAYSLMSYIGVVRSANVCNSFTNNHLTLARLIIFHLDNETFYNYFFRSCKRMLLNNSQ